MESDQAKLFVGGISRETNEEALNGHFSKYGDVSGSVIARERISKNPRGFGFVWFCASSSADKALGDVHVILGRTVSLIIMFLLHYLVFLLIVFVKQVQNYS